MYMLPNPLWYIFYLQLQYEAVIFFGKKLIVSFEYEKIVQSEGPV